MIVLLSTNLNIYCFTNYILTIACHLPYVHVLIIVWICCESGQQLYMHAAGRACMCKVEGDCVCATVYGSATYIGLA